MILGQHELHEVMRSIWESVLGWEIRPVPSTEARDDSRRFQTAFIQIAGAWEGAVVCICSEAFVCQATAALFGMSRERVTVELQHDALGELTNMIGGNLKALLPGPSYLCLPTVVEGTDYSVCVPAAETVVEMKFSSRQEPVAVKLLAGGSKSVAAGRAKLPRQIYN